MPIKKTDGRTASSAERPKREKAWAQPGAYGDTPGTGNRQERAKAALNKAGQESLQRGRDVAKAGPQPLTSSEGESFSGGKSTGRKAAPIRLGNGAPAANHTPTKTPWSGGRR